jgi:hypothetical protein
MYLLVLWAQGCQIFIVPNIPKREKYTKMNTTNAKTAIKYTK